MHILIARRIDSIYGTECLDGNGKPLNMKEYPSLSVVADYFDGLSFPLEQACIEYLIVRTERELLPLEQTDSTLGQYWHAWNKVRVFCDRFHEGMFSDTVAKEYLDANDRKLRLEKCKEWKWKIDRKACLTLQSVLQTGTYAWHLDRATSLQMEGELEEVRQEFLAQLTARNLSKNYINLNDYTFRRFLGCVGVNNLARLQSLEPADVRKGITGLSENCNANSMSTLLPLVRKALGFLYHTGYVDADYSAVVLKGSASHHNVTPYMSDADTSKVVALLDGISLRDKAIITLAIRLGMRDCDIRSLKLNDIDWKDESLSIVQGKTGEPLVLPLLAEVGEAIADYIEHERPNTGCPYVFIRKQAPYKKLSSCYAQVSSILKKADVVPENRSSFGTHLCRYTLAHRLLKIQVPYQVITDVLGHTTSESDKPYLSMDEVMLKKCALDCADVGIVSWKVAI